MLKETSKILICGLVFALENGNLASASTGGSSWGPTGHSSLFGIPKSADRINSELSLDRWTNRSPSIRIEESTNSKSKHDATPAKAQRKRTILATRHNYHNSRRSFGRDYTECRDASLAVAPKTAIMSPIVPLEINFDQETGEDFADPEIMDRFAESALDLAVSENNEWIEWKEHSSTKKLMEEYEGDETAILEQGEVLVYVGKAKQEGHGSNLPIIKTKSILPLSAQDMADLLMDSTKVKIYNKLSLGRDDVQSLAQGTKIVCNLTKPPIAKSNMVSCTMMHSRQLDEGKHLVVSRAAPGMIDESLSDLARNDILLGINLLEDRGPNQCVMTAVTHVYSPALPTILAKKLGVSSAINFVKDIRESCE